ARSCTRPPNTTGRYPAAARRKLPCAPRPSERLVRKSVRECPVAAEAAAFAGNGGATARNGRGPARFAGRSVAALIFPAAMTVLAPLVRGSLCAHPLALPFAQEVAHVHRRYAAEVVAANRLCPFL